MKLRNTDITVTREPTSYTFPYKYRVLVARGEGTPLRAEGRAMTKIGAIIAAKHSARFLNKSYKVYYHKEYK